MTVLGGTDRGGNPLTSIGWEQRNGNSSWGDTDHKFTESRSGIDGDRNRHRLRFIKLQPNKCLYPQTHTRKENKSNLSRVSIHFFYILVPGFVIRPGCLVCPRSALRFHTFLVGIVNGSPLHD